MIPYKLQLDLKHDLHLRLYHSNNIVFIIRILRYECCEGFHRVPGQEGCAGGLFYQLDDIESIKNLIINLIHE